MACVSVGVIRIQASKCAFETNPLLQYLITFSRLLARRWSIIGVTGDMKHPFRHSHRNAYLQQLRLPPFPSLE
jgi:hypothetical protein